MSSKSLSDWKNLKKQGNRLGRAGLSERVFTLVDEFNSSENRSYKNAMVLAGRLKAIAQAATFDSYWNEKMSQGFEFEKRDLENCSLLGTLPEGRKTWWIK